MAEHANSQLNLLEAIRGLTLTAERCPESPGMRVTLVQTGWTDEPLALTRRLAD
jgi:hypothetical protein